MTRTTCRRAHGQALPGMAGGRGGDIALVLMAWDHSTMAWLPTISRAQATGALADAYAAMDNRPMPPVYQAPHGDVPGIIQAHSLDPELLRRTFSVSGALATTGLPWVDRELLASTTSRTNQCFY